MAKKLVSIEGRTRRAEVNKNVVAVLKQWLEMAESGELVAVAIAGVSPDASTHTHASMSDHFNEMLSAVTMLQHRIINDKLYS